MKKKWLVLISIVVVVALGFFINFAIDSTSRPDNYVQGIVVLAPGDKGFVDSGLTFPGDPADDSKDDGTVIKFVDGDGVCEEGELVLDIYAQDCIPCDGYYICDSSTGYRSDDYAGDFAIDYDLPDDWMKKSKDPTDPFDPKDPGFDPTDPGSDPTDPFDPTDPTGDGFTCGDGICDEGEDCLEDCPVLTPVGEEEEITSSGGGKSKYVDEEEESPEGDETSKKMVEVEIALDDKGLILGRDYYEICVNGEKAIMFGEGSSDSLDCSKVKEEEIVETSPPEIGPWQEFLLGRLFGIEI